MLDVIILTKDRPDLLERSLSAVQSQGIRYQGYLVQNGSDDESERLAANLGWVIIKPGYNTSFSEGNNLALKQAQGDRALLINNDAYLRPGALRALLGHDEDIVGANIVQPASGLLNHAGGVLSASGLPLHLGIGSNARHWSLCRRVPWVTFAVALITRDIWERVGGLDEGYWYGYEDPEFCLRALELGAAIVCCGEAVVDHNVGVTRDRNPERRKMERDNRRLYISRWVETGRATKLWPHLVT